MPTDTEDPIYKNSALEFKSTSFSVPVLVISSLDLKQIELLLKEKIAQAPDFFNNSPLIIDLEEINRQKKNIDFSGLIKCLQSNKFIPIGLSGGNDKQNSLALELNIPKHTTWGTHSKNAASAKKKPIESVEKIEKTDSADPPSSTVENMLISQPIRSGQRIYAKGDLTVLSQVGAGAEIMAEGNIHVYGCLRGRALAGVLGNTESRIFCSDLQAELISIAGHYKVNEELEKAEHRKPSQIFLQGQALIIENL